MRVDRVHRFCINGVILIVTSYFITKNSTGFSFSNFLQSVFQPPLPEWVLTTCRTFIWYAVIVRLVLYVIDAFKAEPHMSLTVPQQRCLLKCNTEIDKHLKELFDGKFDLSSMTQKHTYEENLQFLHQSLAEHLTAALKKEKLPSENLFISVFHDPTFSSDVNNITQLEYVSHYDPTFHDTDTGKLSLLDDSTKGFAGVKAFQKNKKVLCSTTGKGQYVVGPCERRQSVKHYIGVPLHVMQRPVALLNIEFHNKQYFKTAREMKAFFRNEIQAFVYMYEYQLHKKYFFHHLNARVAA